MTYKIDSIVNDKDLKNRDEFFKSFNTIAICACGAYINSVDGCNVCGIVSAYLITSKR